MQISLKKEVAICAKFLEEGKLILYPTDTVWGIGCDATNDKAVKKVFALKQRTESKSLIILLSNTTDINKYVQNPEAEIINYISKTLRPTTAIYNNGINVAKNLLNEDGTIAIRIVNDIFCSKLIDRFKKPLVSTSANISGKPAPANFTDIDDVIKNGVDYIVQHRRSDFRGAKPSIIIRMNEEKKIIVLRS